MNEPMTEIWKGPAVAAVQVSSELKHSCTAWLATSRER